jgi:hypothetical protein
LILVAVWTEVKAFFLPVRPSAELALKPPRVGVFMSDKISPPNDEGWSKFASDVRAKKRGLRVAFAFFSPKNASKILLFGQSAFCHAMLAEGNPHIVRYVPKLIEEARLNQPWQAADMYFRNGDLRTWVFVRQQPRRYVSTIESLIGPFSWKTEKELEKKGTLILNWAILCSYIARANGIPLLRERTIIYRELQDRREVALVKLVEAQGADYGLMLAAVASELASGQLECDLETNGFHLMTSLRRVR